MIFQIDCYYTQLSHTHTFISFCLALDTFLESELFPDIQRGGEIQQFVLFSLDIVNALVLPVGVS